MPFFLRQKVSGSGRGNEKDTIIVTSSFGENASKIRRLKEPPEMSGAPLLPINVPDYPTTRERERSILPSCLWVPAATSLQNIARLPEAQRGRRRSSYCSSKQGSVRFVRWLRLFWLLFVPGTLPVLYTPPLEPKAKAFLFFTECERIIDVLLSNRVNCPVML